MDPVRNLLHTASKGSSSIGFSEGQAFLLVFSVASRDSFRRIEGFYNSLMKIKKNPTFLLIGNKCDVNGDCREVREEEGHHLAEFLGCQYLETSAKLGMNVMEIFEQLVRRLRENVGRNLGRNLPLAPVMAVSRIRKYDFRQCVIV